MREGLRSLLDIEEGIEVIVQAEDLRSALHCVYRDMPHVLVLDLGMVRGSSDETIGRLRTRAPGTQIVLLTLEESPVLAQHVLACGALGYVLKDRADAELADAVRAAARGDKYISPRVAGRLNAALRLALTEE